MNWLHVHVSRCWADCTSPDVYSVMTCYKLKHWSGIHFIGIFCRAKSFLINYYCKQFWSMNRNFVHYGRFSFPVYTCRCSLCLYRKTNECLHYRINNWRHAIWPVFLAKNLFFVKLVQFRTDDPRLKIVFAKKKVLTYRY